MRTPVLQRAKNIAIWLAAFFSPTIYFFALIFAGHFHLRAPSEKWIAALFVLIPMAGLFVCCAVAWKSNPTKPRRIGWLVFTLLAMAVQCAVLFFLIAALTTAAISLPQ